MMSVDYRHKDGTIGCWYCEMVVVSTGVTSEALLKICNEEECGSFSVNMSDFDFIAVYEC